MYKHILLPIDIGDDSSWEKSLPVAIELCKSGGASLHVLTVVPDFGMSIVAQYFPENYEREVGEKALEHLKSFAQRHVPDDIDVQHIVGEGTVYQVILDIAKEIDVDLVVLSAHRPALKDYLLGPNASRVVRHADISVLVVR